eukprot:TRINITY_DN9635_c0_g1_i1.p1 TRINITY_DN9635_c0_g1~~TRINITY_DN9635_c0_g1_i1.p1  ORF type:complete len:519 (-),score=145.95 TRINITY_DN9635_c0_g1_i1:145-1701(-)
MNNIGDLFSASKKAEKHREHSIIDHESPDQLKRKRDNFAESLRKKVREGYFQSKRKEDESAELSSEEEMEEVQKYKKRTDLSREEAIKEMGGILTDLGQSDRSKVFPAIKRLRKLLTSDTYNPIQEVIDGGVLPLLIRCAQCVEDKEMQSEAVCCLKGVTTGGAEKIYPLVKKNGIEVLGAILANPNSNEYIKEDAAWALGNIAGESSDLRDAVLKSSAIPSLVQIILEDPKFPLLKSCSWCLCMICKDCSRELVPFALPAFKAIAHLMKKDTNASILIDISWTLYYLVDDKEEQNATVIQLGLVPDLLRLLSKQKEIALRCIQVIGMLSASKTEEVQTIIDAKGLTVLKDLLSSANASIRKQSCWVLSNIAAGPLEHIKEMVRLEIVPTVCKLLVSDEFDVKTEAVWVVANLAYGIPGENIDYLLNLGVIEGLSGMLSTDDSTTLLTTLKGYSYLLQKGKEQPGDNNAVAERMNALGIADSIEKLQYHANEKIYKLAIEILDAYFEIEDAFSIAEAK